MDHSEEYSHEIRHDSVRAGCLLRQPARHVASRRGRPDDRSRARAGRRRARQAGNHRREERRTRSRGPSPPPKRSPRRKTRTKTDAKTDAKTETKESDDKKDKPAEGREDRRETKRKTAKVEAKPLKVVVTLDGTFTAEKMTPVALRPDAWTQFEIVEIVKHGSEVHEGQTLVKFDTEKFDEEIADLELRSAPSASWPSAKPKRNCRGWKRRWRWPPTEPSGSTRMPTRTSTAIYKIDRPMMLKSIEYSLKGAQFQLDYEQDELDQLEKMYEADDLTEDTEEIVLKRSRTEVDFAKFNLEQTKQYCDELLDSPPAAVRHRHQGIARQGRAGTGPGEDGARGRREPGPLRSGTAEADARQIARSARQAAGRSRR